MEFPKYKEDQPVEENKSDDGEMSAENLSDLLGRVSKNSTGGIDSLIGEFEQLRGRLRTDGERIQREIGEYRKLSELVLQITKLISEAVPRSLDN
jgi:hypothetical protein